MIDLDFKLIIDILAYAIKNKKSSFSQKEFKNIVYTDEFNNYEINDNINRGFQYLLKMNLLELESSQSTFYDKFKISNFLQVDIKEDLNNIEELAKDIVLAYETISEKNLIEKIVKSVITLNSKLLSPKEEKEIRDTLCRILLKLDTNYTLFTLIELIKLKAAINIHIKNENNEFNANNLKLENIKFNDSNIILYFDKANFEIKSIKDIKKIDNFDNISIKNSINILETYQNKEVLELKEFLETFKE